MFINNTERVRFADTDMLGVVHHANYFRWFESARVAYLKAAGLDLWDLLNDGYSFPISEARCAYKSPARYDDELIIRVAMRELSRARMDFIYEVWRPKDNALLAEGCTRNVFTAAAGRVARLRDVFYQPLLAFYRAQKDEGGQ